jgi:hypothetical protein
MAPLLSLQMASNFQADSKSLVQGFSPKQRLDSLILSLAWNSGSATKAVLVRQTISRIPDCYPKAVLPV